MHKIPRLFAALVASAALLSVPVALAQDAKDAKSKAAPARADAAAKGKELYSQAYFDFMLKQRTAQGQPDTPELRTAVRDELNTRELLVREAKKQGIDKNPAIKTEMDLTSQTVLVRAFMTDYLKSHPVPEDQMKKEYDVIKGQIGDKEYKVRHILVDKEADAKDIIVALQKGEKFEKLAERSKDTGSKDKGGDLDWNAPANFVKPFSDAMIALQKGKFTTTPVQSQFGWHVIQVDDIREAKVPPYEEVKPQLAQRMQGQVVEQYLKELRAKNGL
jgi:peptidyl-prolyl cis-trans isomerase C